MSDFEGHTDWQVVLVPSAHSSSSRKLVLYNPESNTLQVSSPTPTRSNVSGLGSARKLPRASERAGLAAGEVQIEQLDSDEEITPPRSEPPPTLCPLCYSPLDPSKRSTPTPRQRVLPLPQPSSEQNTRSIRRIPSYFKLLSEANSLANTPTTTRERTTEATEIKRPGSSLDQSQFNEGYFAKFFEEVQLLGRGGQGVVYLVRHLLNGEALGLYACKKIPVGDSTLSLLRILREVHLLEAVQHPNIISYHHAWLETSIPQSFSPAIPTLFVLMAFANGGSLYDFVSARGGNSLTNVDDSDVSLEERKKRFRDRRRGGASGRAVHLLKVEDILTLFKDVVLGLGFLHSRNILHLDLKAENVLLHWEDEALLPTCKLSDFGNATDNSFTLEREGGSGTLAYTAPEAFERDGKTGKLTASNRATDSWGLGLILHLLCFFTLPYRNIENNVQLEGEIRAYRGFFPCDADSLDHGARHDLPDSLLRLIAKLVNVRPSERPSCDKVLQALAEIAKDVESEKSQARSRSPDRQSTSDISTTLVTANPRLIVGVQEPTTANFCPGSVQVNVICLGERYASDFRALCAKNPVPCPLLGETKPGDPRVPSHLALDSDIRTDCPLYRVYSNGKLLESKKDIMADWKEDTIAFFIGCSYSFESALSENGLIPRHTELKRNVPMYKTKVPLAPAGAFTGHWVVSMRPYPREALERVRSITRPFTLAHGEPVAWGVEGARSLGIEDLDGTRPDYGDPSEIREGEIAVYWGCGVTPQLAVQDSNIPEVVLGHSPGHMLVCDMKDEGVCERV
ncbi:hypothetical protein JCM16303_006462 [Sporobolomyces ruberrimus]